MSKAQRLKAARRELRQVADRAAIRPAPNGTGAASWFGYPVVYLLLTIAAADVFTFADSDLWGHLRFGQAMLNAGHLIRFDPYSYSAPGHLWRNHEWLSEVVLAISYNALGVFGLQLLKLCFSAAMVLFLALAIAETGAFPAIQSAVVMLTAPAIAVQMQFRPQLFSFTLTAALMWLLARHTYRGSAPLWLVVPIMGLWANFHGGYIAGLGALGTYALMDSIRGLREQRDWRRGARWGLIVIASVLATLVNPYGIGAWYAVWHALANPLTRTMINDWQPLGVTFVKVWRSYLPGAIIIGYTLGFLLALAVLVALAPRGGDLPLIVVAAIFTAAAFASVRNTALAVIVSSIPLARHLDLAWRERWAGGLDRSDRQRAAPALGGPAPPATGVSEGFRREYAGQLFAGTAAVLLILNGLFTSSIEADAPCPGGAVSFMEQHHLRGNLLALYDWGEYLIWHTAPESKVFMDGRYDTVYPPQVISDYFDFVSAKPEARRVLGAYKHDFVLIPPEADPWELMMGNPAWKLLYRDEHVGLFGHADLVLDGVVTPVVGTAPVNLFP